MVRAIRLAATALVIAAVGTGVALAAVQVNQSDTISFSTFVPCANGGAGEVVAGDVTIHSLITMTINGNRVSGKYHFQPQGGTLTGQTTGAAYQGTGVTQGTFSGSFINGQYQQTDVNNFRIIGQGPGNNFLQHDLAHITITANGDVSVTFTNDSISCK